MIDTTVSAHHSYNVFGMNWSVQNYPKELQFRKLYEKKTIINITQYCMYNNTVAYSVSSPRGYPHRAGLLMKII